jgi:hypothetical protein
VPRRRRLGKAVNPLTIEDEFKAIEKRIASGAGVSANGAMTQRYWNIDRADDEFQKQ